MLTQSEYYTPSQNVPEVIKCIKCNSTIFNPFMCPKCNCSCCKKCFIMEIKKTKKCLFCNQTLEQSELMPSTLVQKIQEVISKEIKMMRPSCENHHLSLIYYCDNCERYLCPDCVVFSKSHKNHRIKKKEELKQSIIEQLNEDQQNLQENINKLKDSLDDINSKISLAHTLKKQRDDELRELYDNLQKMFDIKYKKVIEDLENEQKATIEKIRLLEATYIRINETIIETLPTELTQSAPGFCSSIEELNKYLEKENNKSSEDSNKKEQQLEEVLPSIYSNISVEEKDSIYFEVENLSVCNEECLLKENLKIGGLLWNVYIYPKCSITDNLTFMIELNEELLEPKRFFIKVELVNYMGSQNLSNTFNYTFNKGINFGIDYPFTFEELWQAGYTKFSSKNMGFKVYVKQLLLKDMCREGISFLNSKNSLIELQ